MKSLRLLTDKHKGRCVIAAEWIKAGTILEVAPVKPLTKQLTWRDPLFDYAFAWDQPPYVEAIAFGMISLVNHSRRPNTSITCNFKAQTITLRAIRDILPNEEISFHYDTQLWFAEAI